jgi:hypothetical protein
VTVAALLACVGLALAAACGTLLLARQADRLGFDRGHRGAWLLFAGTSLALPVVGPAALALLMRGLARREGQTPAGIVSVPLAGLPDRVSALREPQLPAGPGSLEARLRFDPAPAHRIAAVLATRRLQLPADAVRLLKLALRDRQEDVRLLAHALLADRDRRAFREIDELEAELAGAHSERRGRLASVLAEALSDVCDAGLVSGELESLTRRRARALREGRAP